MADTITNKAIAQMDTITNYATAYNHQPIVDAIGKTDWWMFGVTMFSALSFVVLTAMIWWTNKKQVKTQIDIQRVELQLRLRKEYYELHSLLLSIDSLVENIWMSLGFPAALMDIKSYKIETNKIWNRTLELRLGIESLLSDDDVKKYEDIAVALGVFNLQILLLDQKFANGALKFLTMEDITEAQNGNEQKRIDLIDRILEHYIADNSIYKKGSAEKLINTVRKYKLHRVTERNCRIYNIIK